MSTTTTTTTAAGLLQVALLLAVLVAVYRPLGDYMARVYTAKTHLRAEQVIYRIVRVDPNADQRWITYAAGVLGFSAVSIVFLYLLQRLQGWLPLGLGRGAVEPGIAFNTAVSFVTNTNWQSYVPESVMGHLVQMTGLTVQNFLSAAVGMAVAVALICGFVRSRTDRLGNFWVDLTPRGAAEQHRHRVVQRNRHRADRDRQHQTGGGDRRQAADHQHAAGDRRGGDRVCAGRHRSASRW